MLRIFMHSFFVKLSAISLCLGSCQLSCGLKSPVINQTNRLVQRYEKQYFIFKQKVKSTRHNKNVLIRLSYSNTPSKIT